LFQKLEEFIQEYLVSEVVADVWVNGSFLTKKDSPSDVDVAVLIEAEVVDTLTDEQLNLINKTNDAFFDPDVNAFAFTCLPKGHEDYLDESKNPALTWHEQFGIENSSEWLKGFSVLRLRESNVGLRLCSR
jgi:predicted nucleotidyltransferase